MNTLIAVGTTAAYVYSVAAIVVPEFFRAAGLGVGDEALPLYFDTAAAIITLILLGRFLEARARLHTSDAIRRLIGLAPRTARVLRDGVELDVPIDEVRVGDIVRVRPGEIDRRRRGRRRRRLGRRREHDHRREPARRQARRATWSSAARSTRPGR